MKVYEFIYESYKYQLVFPQISLLNALSEHLKWLSDPQVPSTNILNHSGLYLNLKFLENSLRHKYIIIFLNRNISRRSTCRAPLPTNVGTQIQTVATKRCVTLLIILYPRQKNSACLLTK